MFSHPQEKSVEEFIDRESAGVLPLNTRTKRAHMCFILFGGGGGVGARISLTVAG